MEQKQLEGEPAIPDALNPTPQTEDAAEAIEQEESQFLAEQLAKAEQTNAALTDKLQRSLAEFDNFRKRTIKEKASMYDDGVRNTIAKLLPVIDNFERAVGAAADKENPFYKGLAMILSQWGETLNAMGVQEIDTVSFTFDPNLHHAVLHIEDDNYGENEIVEELQKGYLYRDKVIRPSTVKVAN